MRHRLASRFSGRPGWQQEVPASLGDRSSTGRGSHLSIDLDKAPLHDVSAHAWSGAVHRSRPADALERFSERGWCLAQSLAVPFGVPG